MIRTTFFLLFICLFGQVLCQDTLVKMNGEQIQVKVLKVSSVEVIFKKTVNLSGPEYTLPISEVRRITYSNGYFEDYNVVDPDDYYVDSERESQNYRLHMRAINDATLYYKEYKGAGTGTLASTLLYPPLGLATAVTLSAIRPKDDNLGVPDSQMAQNEEYMVHYRAEAKRIKQRKVWTNFGFGVSVWVAAFAVVIATQ